MNNVMATLVSGALEDFGIIKSYIQSEKKTEEGFERVVLSVGRVVSEITILCSVYGVWQSLPILGQNSLSGLLKSSVTTWVGYEVCMLVTQYLKYHVENHTGNTVIDSYATAGKKMLATLRNNKSKAEEVLDTKIDQQEEAITQEFMHGYTVKQIEEFTKYSFVPFLLKKIFIVRKEEEPK